MEEGDIERYFGGLPSEEVQQLMDLKYPNGKPIVTLEDREVLYEIVSLIKKFNDFDLVYDDLSNAKSRNDIIFGNRAMFVPRYRSNLETEMMRAKVEATEGGYVCPKCKSTRTIGIQVQTRSADEPYSYKVLCSACNNRWTE